MVDKKQSNLPLTNQNKVITSSNNIDQANLSFSKIILFFALLILSQNVFSQTAQTISFDVLVESYYLKPPVLVEKEVNLLKKMYKDYIETKREYKSIPMSSSTDTYKHGKQVDRERHAIVLTITMEKIK